MEQRYCDECGKLLKDDEILCCDECESALIEKARPIFEMLNSIIKNATKEGE